MATKKNAARPNAGEKNGKATNNNTFDPEKNYTLTGLELALLINIARLDEQGLEGDVAVDRIQEVIDGNGTVVDALSILKGRSRRHAMLARIMSSSIRPEFRHFIHRNPQMNCK